MSSAHATTDSSALHPVLDRLHQDVEWYDRHATRTRLAYQILKTLQLVAAAAIPVSVAAGGGGTVTGSLGGLVVVMEGCQQVFRFHETWLGYRRTWRALLSEQSLFEAEAGIYASAPGDTRLLAERVDGLLSTEVEQWAARYMKESKSALTP